VVGERTDGNNGQVLAGGRPTAGCCDWCARGTSFGGGYLHRQVPRTQKIPWHASPKWRLAWQLQMLLLAPGRRNREFDYRFGVKATNNNSRLHTTNFINLRPYMSLLCSMSLFLSASRM